MKDSHKKSIIQLDKNGNFVQEFDAVTSASELTGISRTSIGNCLRERSKTAGGYVNTILYLKLLVVCVNLDIH